MPRRSRFTATLSHDTSREIVKRVILAYSPGDVRDYYTRKGYVVLGVQRGDYRAPARAAAVKANGGGWRVDRAALRDACDLLGLKLPVSIRFNSRVGRTNGNYRFTGTSHDIMLKSYRTAEQASATLWHELTHALQAERAGSTTAWQGVLADSRGKYQRCPLEIEARAMSRTMSDVPLCK